jgi:hypothetical protein
VIWAHNKDPFLVVMFIHLSLGAILDNTHGTVFLLFHCLLHERLQGGFRFLRYHLNNRNIYGSRQNLLNLYKYYYFLASPDFLYFILMSLFH